MLVSNYFSEWNVLNCKLENDDDVLVRRTVEKETKRIIRRWNWIFRPGINHFQVINNCGVMNKTCLWEFVLGEIEEERREAEESGTMDWKWHETQTKKKYSTFQLLNIFLLCLPETFQVLIVSCEKERERVKENNNEGSEEKRNSQNRLYNENSHGFQTHLTHHPSSIPSNFPFQTSSLPWSEAWFPELVPLIRITINLWESKRDVYQGKAFPPVALFLNSALSAGMLHGEK